MVENEDQEETQITEEKEDSEIKESAFDLEEELLKEKKYLRNGFRLFISQNGYDVDTKRKYNMYMKKYKEA